MAEIVTLLSCLSNLLPKSTLKQLQQVVFGMVCMTGKVTMLGISRWTEQGGSYRSIERCYTADIDWDKVHWQFFREHEYEANRHYLLAGDEVVVAKAGKATHGVGRHYSSIAQQVIPSVAFFTLSLIDTEQRTSHPILTEQCVRGPIVPALPVADKPKRGRGRPKGSTNKPKTSILNPELQQIESMAKRVLDLTQAQVKLTHWVLDGHFGNAPSAQMVRQTGLHLISKLRQNAALYLPYTGPYAGRGPHRRYGNKLSPFILPESALQTSRIDAKFQTDIYQLHALHKEFTDPLNIVIIVKTNLKTGKRGYVILFSTDLTLPFDLLIDYYSLRFQIEFNFRDAKQFWGLDDFMNINPQPVTNAANLAFFLVKVSHCLCRPFQEHNPDFSILDLKAHYRAQRYLSETINLLPLLPDNNLLSRIFQRLSTLGAIHPSPPIPKAA